MKQCLVLTVRFGLYGWRKRNDIEQPRKQEVLVHRTT